MTAMNLVSLIRFLTVGRWFAHWRRETRIMRTTKSGMSFPRIIYVTRLMSSLLLFVALTAVAQSGDFTYATNDGMITITGYAGPGGDVDVPSTITGLPVVRIGDRAFSSFHTLTNITIPNAVTAIGSSAFSSCINLTFATIGKGLRDIGDRAFSQCTNLAGVYFEGNSPTLGLSVFESDTNVIVYYSPQALGWLSTLGDRPTVLLPFKYTVSDGAITINEYTGNVFGSIVNVPSTIRGLPVAGIAGYAFYSSSSLASVAILGNVKSIGAAAFLGCRNLTNVNLGDSVVTMGDHAFSSCPSLTCVTIGNNVTTVGRWSFSRCPRLTTITLPNSVTNLGDWAFSECTGLTNLTLPDRLTYIADGLFAGCTGAARVTIPATVTTIGSRAFSDCDSLTDVTIPANVTSLWDFAFFDCDSLTVIAIPSSVTSLGDLAFGNCNNLVEVYLQGDPPNVGYSVFNNAYPTLFYLSTSRGWFPQVLAGSGSLGVQASGFGFSITGANSMVVVVEACTNLANHFWIPVVTNTIIDGSFRFSDPAWMNYSERYYRAFGAAFADRPTALWKPWLPTSRNSFGARTNQFGFNIAWASGQTFVVEACTDLANPVWSPLQTNTLAGDSLYFSDPDWTNYPGRFYRVRSP